MSLRVGAEHRVHSSRVSFRNTTDSTSYGISLWRKDSHLFLFSITQLNLNLTPLMYKMLLTAPQIEKDSKTSEMIPILNTIPNLP